MSTTNERGTAHCVGGGGKGIAAGTRLETRARVRALQALYAWDVRCAAQSRRAQLGTVATNGGTTSGWIPRSVAWRPAS